MRKILILTVVCVASLFARQIQSVNFTGLNLISPTSAARIAGLEVGEELTEEKIDRAIINLFAQGYFDNAFVEENGGNITIHLKEKPVIARLNIEGVVTNDKDKMQQIIAINPGNFYDDVMLKRSRENIKNFYQAQGYFDTVTEFETTPLNDSNSSIVMDAVINRGENVIIKKINFIGSDYLSYSDVSGVISNHERETLGWMWGFYDGKLKINELPNDAAKIKEAYMKKGYLDANVSLPYVDVYRDNYTADLTYYIQEGKQYSVNSININAPKNLNLDTKKIISDFKLKSGKRMSSDWLRKDMEKLSNIVADQGYAFVDINPVVVPNKEHPQTVDITFEVVPHNEIYVRNVTVTGNEKTADKVVRREMYLTEGEKYNRTDLIDSRNALRRSGYFDAVEVSEQRVGENEIDLIVDVKEAPTGSITGGVGYGSEDGFLVSAGISERNLFGTGLKGDIYLDMGDDTTSGTISLTNPRVFDSPYSLGMSVFMLERDWDDYEVDTKGFSITGGRKLGRYTNLYLTYKFEDSDVSGIDEFYKLAGYQDDQFVTSSLIPSIVFNNTDDYFTPRSGIIANASYQYAGIGGDLDYQKLNLGFKWFYGLEDMLDWDVIFRYRAQYNYLWGEDDNLPTNEKVFLGGISTVRGFDSRSIPQKKFCNQNGACDYVDVGGKQAFSNSFELSFPLIERINMRFITFFDYGMIGENSLDDEHRYSVGAGIEWNSPLGMLQIYYAEPLNDENYDDTNRFEFSIGRRF
ncbi:MAG: outer membrane protein assembly factor BamA [Campylobacter sp.]|nr:outer membrane protein assembly factor BamA [Campylobacter sp.]